MGHEVSVLGKVVFDVECPPPEGGGQCDATGYLTALDREVFARDDTQVLLLHEGGALVRCKAATELHLECRGWRQGAKNVVHGVVQRYAGVDSPAAFVIDVTSKEAA